MENLHKKIGTFSNLVVPNVKGKRVKTKLKHQLCLTEKIKNKDWQIVNGTTGHISEFPYQAFIGYYDRKTNTSFICEGSVITDHHILSAAHCAVDWWNTFYFDKNVSVIKYALLEPPYYLVHVGSSTVKNSKDGQYLEVSEVHVHPDFLAEGTMGRDLSVLKTSQRLILSDTVATVPVATPDLSHHLEVMENSRTKCIVAGWGTLSASSLRPQHLRYVNLPLMPIETCIELGKLSDFHIKRDVHLCTYEIDKDICFGDSGSALVCNTLGVPTIWGVVSFGDNCAGKLKPGYYARVDNAYSFLKQFLENNSSRSAVSLEVDMLTLLFLLVLQMIAN